MPVDHRRPLRTPSGGASHKAFRVRQPAAFTPIPVYIEAGTRRTFAGGLEWPGWCRSGKTENEALKTLAAYASRYRSALGDAGRAFPTVPDVSQFEVVERVKGNATTDFGAPGVQLKSDGRPLGEKELSQLTGLLHACWDRFDTVASEAEGRSLKKGPRGGGRDAGKMRSHLFEADEAYLKQLGGRYRGKGDAAPDLGEVRELFLAALAARMRGELPDRGPKGGLRWTPSYAIRRSAWHALDHAWEIEDRLL